MKKWGWIGAIILVCLLNFSFLLGGKLPAHDISTFYYPTAETLKQSLELGDFWPLWNPYGFSGTPFLMKPAFGLDSLLGLLLLLIPSTVIALKLTYLLSLMIAGVSMFFFLRYLKLEDKYAFIGALTYVLSGHMAKIMAWGWLTTIGGLAIMPLAWLFGMKALKEKNWLTHSIIAGVIFAVLLRMNPDVKVLLWFGLSFGLYLLYELILTPTKERLKQVSLVAFVILAVFFLLSAQRILPNADFIKSTVRAETSWEVASGRRLSYENLFSRLVQPVPKGIRGPATGDYLGIVASILAGIAVWKRIKDKRVLFFTGLALFSVMVATNTFGLYYLLWKFIPFVGSLRYMDRSLFLFAFSGAVLASIGAKELLEKKQNWYWPVVFLLILNLAIFGFSPQTEAGQGWWNVEDAVAQNSALQFISSQPGIFRINTLETQGIDWSTDLYNVPLKLEHIYRYDTAWYPPYLNGFLTVAQNAPLRFWGLLNVRYITSRQPVNSTSLELVNEFPPCTVCFPEIDDFAKAWGPYVYENKEFLPRAYVVPQAILVVGREDAVTQTIYAMLLHPGLNPSSTVVIRGKEKISLYTAEELSQYNAVFLTQGSVENSFSGNILQSYVDQGGKLLPDVLNEKTTIAQEEIDALFISLASAQGIGIPDNSVEMLDFDTRKIAISGQQGWLVLSEKFSVFPGWVSNKEFFNANAMNTAVWLEGNENSVSFTYKPASFALGNVITGMTCLFLLAWIGVLIFKKKKNVQGETV